MTAELIGPGGPDAGSGIKVEVPSGAVDGANSIYTTTAPFVLGKTILFLNGLAQSEPQDYNEITNQSVLLDTPPLVNDRLRIAYVEAP